MKLLPKIEDVKVGQYWRVRVSSKRTMLGKVLTVRNSVTLERVNTDGEPIGGTDRLNLIVCGEADLVRQMQMDNFYGMIVEMGKAKIHSCNHNLPEPK